MRSASAAVMRQPVSSSPPDEPVDPEPAVGIEHHLDDGRIFEIGSDRWAERGAQHARAASEGFRSEGDRRHVEPRSVAQEATNKRGY